MLIVVGVLRWQAARADAARPALGLFTTLPILWAEAPDVAAQLSVEAPPHWAKAALERQYRVKALDTLDDLKDLRLLMLAQPRALSARENVALDAWVQGGGRVLVFADPMLTWESAFPIGDRRRPQDVVLLSPILARWGLELTFDDGQPGGLREIAGSDVPANLAGQLRLRPGGVAQCRIGQGGLVAECRAGRGKATIVADAALLEPVDDPAQSAARLQALMDRAFAG